MFVSTAGGTKHFLVLVEEMRCAPRQRGCGTNRVLLPQGVETCTARAGGAPPLWWLHSEAPCIRKTHTPN